VTESGGVNALDAMLDTLAGIRALQLDSVQVSITRLDGGTARQITAAHASAWIDLRADVESDMAAAVLAIGEVVASVQRESTATVVLTGGQTRPAFPRAAAEDPWAILTRMGVPEGAIGLTAVHERGGSDASTFAASGVPTIDGFGPVCFDNCAVGESVDIDSVASRTSLMASLITAWSRVRS
jgi:glutamate carboxypeptidase